MLALQPYLTRWRAILLEALMERILFKDYTAPTQANTLAEAPLSELNVDTACRDVLLPALRLSAAVNPHWCSSSVERHDVQAHG